MKHLKHYSRPLIVILLAVFLLMSAIPVSFGALNEGQVRVPLVIDVSYAVAGVEFAFEYSAGLEFISYEKSAVVSSALNTPVVVKKSCTYLGFYNADNRYMPENGKLDCGYLIFKCSSDTFQVVKLTEIKLVQVIDKDTTRSTLLTPVEIKISPENNTENTTVNNNDNSGSVDGGLSSGSKNSSTSGGSVDGGSSFGVRNQPESSKNGGGDGVLSVDNDSGVDGSKDSWLSASFWVAIVFLVIIVVVCGVGVFVFLKKRTNPK
ncbi:MAG: hypothetical protein FWF66_02720 [Candidatus Bathyarchaeota archaeon]|nr:hypothetical protein [Candidatus Termiticorpusculum sp.]